MKFDAKYDAVIKLVAAMLLWPTSAKGDGVRKVAIDKLGPLFRI